MQQDRESKIAETILYSSLFLSIAGCTLLLWQESKGLALLSGVLIIAVTIGRPLLSRFVGSKKLAGWALTLATLNLFLVVPELGFRVAGFRAESGIQFGYPRPTAFMGFAPDERLFWRLQPSTQYANSLGFPGDEIVSPKPAGRYRVMFLGDSCTQQGYPDIVESFLNESGRNSSTQVEAITLALSGYSSHQGRVLAELYGETLEPDVAVVYFGWNDHWLAYQTIDSQKVVKGTRSPWASSLAVARRLRLVQGLESLSASVSGSDMPIDQVRVPIPQYQENLLRVQKTFERRKVPVVFISAPTSHYRLGVPDYLVDLHFVADKASSVALHRSYNQIVREVAKATGSYLLDLEQNFDSRNDLNAIFMADGIHFTQSGLALVAKRVSDFLEVRQSV
jgi:lysophospholipase L1-like esterase